MYVSLNVRCLIFPDCGQNQKLSQFLVNMPSLKFRGSSSCGSALFRVDKEKGRHAATARTYTGHISHLLNTPKNDGLL